LLNKRRPRISATLQGKALLDVLNFFKVSEAFGLAVYLFNVLPLCIELFKHSYGNWLGLDAELLRKKKNCSALSIASGSGGLASHVWVPLWQTKTCKFSNSHTFLAK